MSGKALLVAAIVALAGCATTETRLVCPDIPEVVRPLLPTAQGDELACLSDSTYERMEERQRLRRNYAEDLAAILDGLREECARIESEN